MRELGPIYQHQAAGLLPTEQHEAAGFIRKLDSFVHAPLNRAAANRLLPFSQQPTVVALVARVLPQYQPWARPYYDIIGYWYSVALLSLARSEEALQALDQLTTEALAAGWTDLNLLRRNYRFFPEAAELAPLASAVDHYFQQLLPQTDSLIWARQIGLQVPPAPTWQASFELSTDGKKRFAFELSPAEKAQRLELAVSVYGAARGNGQSWDIRFGNVENTTAGNFFGSSTTSLRVQNRLLELPAAPSLLHFADTLAALEAAVGASFVRRISFSYFSNSIKNRGAVASWLAALPPASLPS
ncbi:hypothetical protein [Hymenobacter ruricola]|uniref:Uncharacterized protein n=1 Tax=Hymenobacter ruricola TaxID=2791023 RepID=A0ABS0I0E4_9BACT|nr:hypothetical protein [Hymenobacter ruricola]MBF9220419.1 hypothetical protein [Hymenobacter ruricola]